MERWWSGKGGTERSVREGRRGEGEIGVWGDGGREGWGDAAWAKGDLAAAPFAAVPRWTEVA